MAAAYSQEEIDRLIHCPKKVESPPKRESKLVGADYRNDLTLVASDGTEGQFYVFIRQSEDFPENFSVGLRYQPVDDRGEIVLLRCNGPHGVYNGGAGSSDHPHWDYHIHKASEEAITSGQRAEKQASATREYATLNEAVQYFIREINLSTADQSRYFPPATQQSLFVV